MTATAAAAAAPPPRAYPLTPPTSPLPCPLLKVIRGYVGDKDAKPIFESPTPFDIIGSGYQRPLELATQRLFNMIGILPECEWAGHDCTHACNPCIHPLPSTFSSTVLPMPSTHALNPFPQPIPQPMPPTHALIPCPEPMPPTLALGA